VGILVTTVLAVGTAAAGPDFIQLLVLLMVKMAAVAQLG